MNRLLISLGFVLASTATLLAQDATPADVQRAKAYLKKTHDAVVTSTKGLSEAQWNFKPTPERWSVAEVVEHIAVSEGFLMNMITGPLLQAPPRSEPANLEELDALVLKAIPDRTSKFKAPEPLMPNRRFGSPQDSLTHFAEARAKTIKFLEETKNLRGHAGDSPLGQKLDVYQWLLFVGAHCERHTKQLEEVKADPNFPKS